MTNTVYVATAEIDPANFAWLNALRKQHFPAERNFLAAHLTLFHRLSAFQLGQLAKVPVSSAVLPLAFTGARFLGNGVAIEVVSPALVQWRQDLKAAMGDGLSAQDNQNWRPHVTVQNKVDPKVARELFEALSGPSIARTGGATALLLWEYLGGPWKLHARQAFA